MTSCVSFSGAKPYPAHKLPTFSKPQVIETSSEKCNSMSNTISIPLEKAIVLCREHRDKHKIRLFSQCWGCLRFSKEEFTT